MSMTFNGVYEFNEKEGGNYFQIRNQVQMLANCGKGIGDAGWSFKPDDRIGLPQKQAMTG